MFLYQFELKEPIYQATSVSRGPNEQDNYPCTGYKWVLPSDYVEYKDKADKMADSLKKEGKNMFQIDDEITNLRKTYIESKKAVPIDFEVKDRKSGQPKIWNAAEVINVKNRDTSMNSPPKKTEALNRNFA